MKNKSIISLFLCVLFMTSGALNAKHYRIVSFDSGGVTGFISMNLMHQIEATTGLSFIQWADGVAGGTNALLLGAGKSAAEGIRFYKEEASKYYSFTAQSFLSKTSTATDQLAIVANGYFGDKGLSTALLPTQIWAASFADRSKQIFDSDVILSNHAPEVSFANVLRVTSSVSAPVFLPIDLRAATYTESTGYVAGDNTPCISPSHFGSYDNTASAYQFAQHLIADSHTAVLYSFGGLAPRSEETNKLIAKNGSSARILVVRIEPTPEQVAALKAKIGLAGLTNTLAVASALKTAGPVSESMTLETQVSPEMFAAMGAVVTEMSSNPYFGEVLRDLQTVAKTKKPGPTSSSSSSSSSGSEEAMKKAAAEIGMSPEAYKGHLAAMKHYESQKKSSSSIVDTAAASLGMTRREFEIMAYSAKTTAEKLAASLLGK